MKSTSSSQADFAIGIFDSGIGGLTVASSIIKQLPKEKVIYFGDTAHLPYGEKSSDAIRYYSLKICKLLVENNCKMIVVACNTASSAAYQILLEFFQDKVLFVNVVDPLVRKAGQLAKKKVGVIATKATIRSNVYKSKLLTLRPDLNIVQLATPLFAPMIEEGFHNNNISKSVIENYLGTNEFEDIDTLLLACTHYPLIKEEIDHFFEGKVQILDSTKVTASSVAERLKSHELINHNVDPEHQFYVSDYSPSFEKTTKIFFNQSIDLKENQIW